MKKILHILFLLIYLIPTIGFSLSYHFCGDILHSVSLDFSVNTKEPNDCCGENEKDNVGCCHTQIKHAKINDFQLSESNSLITNYKELFSFIESFVLTFTFDNINTFQSIFDNSPPTFSNHIYLTNSTLLI